jgi:hypothetical protein
MSVGYHPAMVTQGKQAAVTDLMLGVSLAYASLCQALIESGAVKGDALLARLVEAADWSRSMGHPLTAQWLEEMQAAVNLPLTTGGAGHEDG